MYNNAEHSKQSHKGLHDVNIALHTHVVMAIEFTHNAHYDDYGNYAEVKSWPELIVCIPIGSIHTAVI